MYAIRSYYGQVREWTRLLFDFLRGRANLRRVYLLIDARHGIKDNDRQALDILDQAAVSYQVVLTKADKPTPADLAAVVAATELRITSYNVCYTKLLRPLPAPRSY